MLVVRFLYIRSSSSCVLLTICSNLSSCTWMDTEWHSWLRKFSLFWPEIGNNLTSKCKNRRRRKKGQNRNRILSYSCMCVVWTCVFSVHFRISFEALIFTIPDVFQHAWAAVWQPTHRQHQHFHHHRQFLRPPLKQLTRTQSQLILIPTISGAKTCRTVRIKFRFLRVRLFVTTLLFIDIPTAVSDLPLIVEDRWK